MSSKRKQKTLSLQEKCRVLDSLEEGRSIRQVSEQFKIGKSTVFDIKQKKSQIRKFVARSYERIGRSLKVVCHFL